MLRAESDNLHEATIQALLKQNGFDIGGYFEMAEQTILNQIRMDKSAGIRFFDVFHNQLTKLSVLQTKTRYFKGFPNLLRIYFVSTKMRCF